MIFRVANFVFEAPPYGVAQQFIYRAQKGLESLLDFQVGSFGSGSPSAALRHRYPPSYNTRIVGGLSLGRCPCHLASAPASGGDNSNYSITASKILDNGSFCGSIF